MKFIKQLLAVTLCLGGAIIGSTISVPASAQNIKVQWKQIAGKSLDIGVGHRGHVWSIGPNRLAWRWDGRSKWIVVPGIKNLRNIDAAPDGSAMAVRSDGTLHYNSGKPRARWQQAGVRTMDVGIGGGWVWLTNTQKTNGGGQIWRSRYTPGRWKWQRVPGGLMRLDVDPKGNAWGLNNKNDIYRYDGRRWVKVPGKSYDLGIGGDGSVWGIAASGFNKGAGGGQVYRYDPKVSGHWRLANGRLARISVNPQGKPVGANTKQQIWFANSVKGPGIPLASVPGRGPQPVGVVKVAGAAGATPAQLKLFRAEMERLLKQMPLLPKAMTDQFRKMVSGVKLIKGANYFGINKGNVYIYAEKPGATKNSGSGFSMFLLIKGRITPNLPNKFLNNFKGSDLSDIILSAVKTQAKELNKGKRKREEIALKDLPKELGAVVKKHYGDLISFPAGFQAAARIKLNGVFADAVKAIGLPNDKLLLRLGMEQPEYSISGPPPNASENTFYAELIRRGAWKKPFNLAGTTIWDTTIGINTDLIMKISGYGYVNKGNNFVLYYDGPVPRNNVPPDDWKKLSFAFGARELSYKQYVNLMLSFQVPSASGKLSFVNKIGGFSNTVINGVKKGVNYLPLDAVKILQPKLNNYKFKSGEFPTTETFVVQGVGPKGKLGEEEGPLVRLSGKARALGMHVASFTGRLSKSGLKAEGAAGDILSLGPLGKAGMKGTLSTQIDASKQFFGMTGKISAGKLGGRDFTLDLKPTAVQFSSPSSCAYPLKVTAKAKITDPRKISLKNIPFVPLMSVPDPGKMVKCGAELLYAIKDGVVYVFKGGKKVIQFADNLMQKNEATKLASGALKFAGGKAAKAAGEAAKLIKADQAAKAVGKAAEAAKKAAAAAKREAAKRAKEAAAAAKAAANIAKDVAKNVGREAGKQFVNAFKSFGGAIGSVLGKKKKSAPRPPNANDCKSNEFWNHVTKRCMTRGYSLLVHTKSGTSKPMCLDIINATVHNGQHVHTYNCNGGWWQQWRRESNGWIRTPNNRCLDAKKMKVGEEVHTWTCTNKTSQKWTIDQQGRMRTANGLCAVPNHRRWLGLTKCGRLPNGVREWSQLTLFKDYHREYGMAKEYLLPIHMHNEWACHAENHIWQCNAAPAYKNGHLIYTIAFVNDYQFALINRQKKTCISTDAFKNGRNVFAGGCNYEQSNLWTAQQVGASGHIDPNNASPRHMLGGVFVFRNVQSGLCLTSKWGNIDNRAAWGLKSCNIALHPTQRVKLRGVGVANRGTWGHPLKSAKLATGGQCMTVGADKRNGVHVSTYSCKSRLNRKLAHSKSIRAQVAKKSIQAAKAGMRHAIEYLDNGTYFAIRPRLEFGRQCFDVSGGSVADHARIVQWPCHRQHNQQWRKWGTRGNTFAIQNRKSGKCIYRSNSRDPKQRGKLFQVTCNSNDGKQRFSLM